jgi:hypothetical protein
MLLGAMPNKFYYHHLQQKISLEMCGDHQTPRTETASIVQDIDDVDSSHKPWFRDTWVSKLKKEDHGFKNKLT